MNSSDLSPEALAREKFGAKYTDPLKVALIDEVERLRAEKAGLEQRYAEIAQDARSLRATALTAEEAKRCSRAVWHFEKADKNDPLLHKLTDIELAFRHVTIAHPTGEPT